LHFFMNEVLAAPASGLPSLPTALLSQVSSAKAEPAAKVATTAARKIRFIIGVSLNNGSGIGTPNRGAIKQDQRPTCRSFQFFQRATVALALACTSFNAAWFAAIDWCRRDGSSKSWVAPG